MKKTTITIVLILCMLIPIIALASLFIFCTLETALITLGVIALGVIVFRFVLLPIILTYRISFLKITKKLGNKK